MKISCYKLFMHWIIYTTIIPQMDFIRVCFGLPTVSSIVISLKFWHDHPMTWYHSEVPHSWTLQDKFILVCQTLRALPPTHSLASPNSTFHSAALPSSHIHFCCCCSLAVLYQFLFLPSEHIVSTVQSPLISSIISIQIDLDVTFTPKCSLKQESIQVLSCCYPAPTLL